MFKLPSPPWCNFENQRLCILFCQTCSSAMWWFIDVVEIPVWYVHKHCLVFHSELLIFTFAYFLYVLRDQVKNVPEQIEKYKKKKYYLHATMLLVSTGEQWLKISKISVIKFQIKLRFTVYLISWYSNVMKLYN